MTLVTRKEVLVSVRGLSKYYGDLAAVRGLDLQILDGEVVGLVGPPGAGKSTILRILAGSLAYSSGEVTVLGFDPVVASNEVWRRVGYYPERLDLFEHMTVEGCARFWAHFRSLSLDRVIREAKEEWGLQASLGTRFVDLSDLDRRRVALWCSCMHDPPLLLVDEPLRGLGSQEKSEFVNLLSKAFGLRGGAIASASIADVWPLCAKILMISHGKPTLTVEKREASYQAYVAETI